MNSIALGKSADRNITLDLDTLITTRLLIQANSGQGKSWLLRLIAEQCHGKLPVIIIDPEGEFATLREKFGYVLVGPGGETPADVRSAGLLAETLLKLRASAVCDLFEAFRKNPQGRHEWVKRFIEAMLDAPKSLWHPTLVIVDEAHYFCPEKGDSVASQAMVGLCTAGRKRGFCAVWATQRLALLKKDASAMLMNRLVGGTFEDVDVERAAELLSVSREDKLEFKRKIRVLEPGTFFALGRAITRERTLFKAGGVQTTHPEVGPHQHVPEPPPAPEEIKALLPKLADLPKAAEEKARTEAELRAEIRSLKAQLKSAPKETVEVKVADEKAIQRAYSEAQSKWILEVKRRDQIIEKMIRGARTIAESAASIAQMEVPAAELPSAPAQAAIPSLRPVPAPAVHRVQPAIQSNGDLSGPQRRILNAIAWMNAVGVEQPEQPAVAFLAGYTYGAGGYNNPRGALNQAGLVQYVPGDRIELTEAGKAKAEMPDVPLSNEGLQAMVLGRLPGPAQKILRVLIGHYPEAISNDQCAQEAGYTANAGGYNNPRGRLRTLGLIEYPQPNHVRARDILFIE